MYKSITTFGPSSCSILAWPQHDWLSTYICHLTQGACSTTAFYPLLSPKTKFWVHPPLLFPIQDRQQRCRSTCPWQTSSKCKTEAKKSTQYNPNELGWLFFPSWDYHPHFLNLKIKVPFHIITYSWFYITYWTHHLHVAFFGLYVFKLLYHGHLCKLHYIILQQGGSINKI